MSPFNGWILASLLLTCILFAGLVSFLTDYETGKAEMTYMFEYPQFVRISHDVDLVYKKYGLYAYSEGGSTEKARNMIFDGIPVLFIPGSGGSHKQCRSFASIALRKFLNSRTKFHFDYFTIDLNNELTGLNGALLQEQLNYVNSSIYQVLSLYQKQKDPPKSIILIGHSMGGVLAKAIIAQLPLDSHLVPIVIALSAPLTRPVLALDYFFQSFYTKMNKNFLPPESTVFITVAGGFNDFMVPPHLTEDGDIHVIATQVPKSWITTDHLSVVWCKQLVMAINRALFDSVNPETKRINTNRDFLIDVFNHHLVKHPGIKIYDMDRYQLETLLQQSSEWHEGQSRQYSVRLPKGTREVRWYLIPVIMKPGYEFITLVGVNMKARDWVYACSAYNYINNKRFCESGRHLTHLSEISPSIRYKRRTLRTNLHDVKMNYTTATHIAVRVLPSTEPTALHIDIYDPYTRHLIFNPSLLTWSEVVMKESVEKAVHYEILLPRLTQLIQSYTMCVDAVCTGQGHHATFTLEVPWNNHDLHHYYTDALKQPFTFKLYKARPADAKGYALLKITLDPSCRYKLKMTNNWDYGLMVRIYTPMLIANAATVILITLYSQLKHIGDEQRCSFIFTALKESAKPYYVVTITKLISKLLSYPLPLIGSSDNPVIMDENTDVLLLPLVFYLLSVGIVWLLCLGLSISLVCFESTFHKIGVKFFTSAFAERVGWTDHLLKAFDKIPGVVACILITMSYTTCGGLAICLATIFYFLKLTQMAQDLIEDFVKRVAKSIAFKVRDKIWDKIKRRWFNTPELTTSSAVKIENEEKLSVTAGDEAARYDDNEAGPSGAACCSSGVKVKWEMEWDDDDDDYEKPMQFEVQRPGDPDGTSSKVDGDTLVELLNRQMAEAIQNTQCVTENTDESFFDKLTFGLDFIREAMENNEMFFHFTIFLIYLVVAALNIPSVLTWARNYKYNKSLVPDPLFIPGLIMSACAAPLWQLEFPRVEKKYFTEVARIVYCLAIVLLTHSVISIYRISFIFSFVVALVTLHQLLAPDYPETVVNEESAPPPDSEADSYSERVKSKWE